MKTKIIAVIVVLSISFCANSFGQIGGLKGGNNTQPTPPVNNGVNNNNTTTPTPTVSPNVFGNSTLNGIYNEVRKSTEYQAFEKRVKAKVNSKINSSKVGKSASKFRRFLQRMGLAKTPARKPGAPVKR